MAKKEVLILQGIGARYAVHLYFGDIEELRKVEKALKPLGYKFRFPKER